MRRWLHRTRQEKGAALVETAFVLPIMLLVCVGILEFGRAYQTWQVLTNASREGARVAILPEYTDASAIARVKTYLKNGGLPASIVDSANTKILITATTIPIDVGGRLTGKVGKVSLGVLNIQTAEEPAARTPQTNFTVVRVKRDVLRRSAVGAMVTNRSNSATTVDASNQGYGVDGIFNFFSDLTLGGYYSQTQTTDLKWRQELKARVDFSPDMLAPGSSAEGGRDVQPESASWASRLRAHVRRAALSHAKKVKASASDDDRWGRVSREHHGAHGSSRRPAASTSNARTAISCRWKVDELSSCRCLSTWPAAWSSRPVDTASTT